jgi:hypothetical protein
MYMLDHMAQRYHVEISIKFALKFVQMRTYDIGTAGRGDGYGSGIGFYAEALPPCFFGEPKKLTVTAADVEKPAFYADGQIQAAAIQT